MKVMKAVIDFYKSREKDISSYSEKLIDALKPTPSPQGEIKEPIVVTAASTILSSFDPQNGGFGLAPKFPMSGGS